MATLTDRRVTLRAFHGSDEPSSANDSLPLFPPVPHRDTERQTPSPPEPAANRVGIARLAASSPLADSKRGAEYFLLPAKSILNRCDSERVPFTWTVNPYRGCEFGCKYCYARYTHEYMELDGRDFERKIFVKQDAGPMAFRELRSSAVRGEHIAIGTATDPYQPAERRLGITRAILEVLRDFRHPVTIVTKGALIQRDLDILGQMARDNLAVVTVSVTTLDRDLARRMEPPPRSAASKPSPHWPRPACRPGFWRRR